jgi:hypothetical protein
MYLCHTTAYQHPTQTILLSPACYFPKTAERKAGIELVFAWDWEITKASLVETMQF